MQLVWALEVWNVSPFSVGSWRPCLQQHSSFRDLRQRLPPNRATAGAGEARVAGSGLSVRELRPFLLGTSRQT